MRSSFVPDLIHRTGLERGSHMVDLGCGLGDLLLRTSLASGCNVWGIEQRVDLHRLGVRLMKEVQELSKSQGLRLGTVILRQGDFCHDENVRLALDCADVVVGLFTLTVALTNDAEEVGGARLQSID